MLLIFLIVFILPDNLLAADSSRPSTPPVGAVVGFLVWLICFLRRKRPIGGWLLYYFIGLYGGLAVSIVVTIASLPNYSPAQWDTMLHYFLFIITTVPNVLFLLAQVFLSFFLFSQNRRNWKYIETLKTVLLLDFAFSLLSIAIDAALWSASVFFSAYSAVLSLIWFFYFKRSARVRYVFKDRNWDWETLHPKKIAS
jgi:hypothetical protein